MDYLKQQKSYMSLAMSGTAFNGGMKLQVEKDEDSGVKQVVRYMRKEDSYKEDLLQRMEMGRQAAEEYEEYQSNGSQYQVRFIKGDQHYGAKVGCFEFREKGKCRFGDTCKYSHQGSGKAYIERDTRRETDMRASSLNQGRTTSPGGGSYYQQGGREDRRRSPSPKRPDGRQEDRGRSRSPVTDRDDRRRAGSPYPYPSKQIGSESQRVKY